MKARFAKFKKCCRKNPVLAIVYDIDGNPENDQKFLLCKDHWERTDSNGNKIYQQDIKSKQMMN